MFKIWFNGSFHTILLFVLVTNKRKCDLLIYFKLNIKQILADLYKKYAQQQLQSQIWLFLQKCLQLFAKEWILI